MTLDRQDIQAIAREVAEQLRAPGGGDVAFYTPQTLAKKLAVSERTVWTMLHDGRLPSYRVGNSRRIDPADVLRYLSSTREERVA